MLLSGLSLNAQTMESFLISGSKTTGEYFEFKSIALDTPSNGFLRLGGVSSDWPKQRFHIMGGSILLTEGPNSSLSGSKHGSVYFGSNGQFGMWGIEYNDDQCAGGLNFWKPYGATYPTENFILFLSNSGEVGIGTNEPVAKFHVAGTAYINESLKLGDGIKESNLEVTGNIFSTGLISSNTLVTGGGKKMVVADEGGALNLAEMPEGDNMGNHIATNHLNIGDFSIYNGSGTRSTESWQKGLALTDDNNAILSNTSNCFFQVLGGSNMNSGMWVSNWESSGYGFVQNNDNITAGIYCDMNNPKPLMNFYTDKVGIGVMPPETSKYKLFVTGGILTEEVLIKLQSDWADFVFDKDYKLRSLIEVEQFIKDNKHLPDVPSASDVKENGIAVGEMNAILLQKIEELMLYVIEQQKQIDLLKELNYQK